MASSAQLTERYRPQRLAEFAGLDKPKRIFSRFVSNPFASAYLFVGPSGTGKTTFARALANEIDAEILHVASQECTIDVLRKTVSLCYYAPMSGKRFWMVLVDEADTMSKAAQDSLLSTLDELPPETIFVFTCNETERFEPRFLSRVIRVEFSSYGIAKDATALLQRVWTAEAPGSPAPNVARIVKENNNNLRGSLMALETELMLA